MEPLAIKLRPNKLDDIYGQDKLIGKNGILRKCVEKNTIFSMILFGPPGCGKTTLAYALANELNMHICYFSPVTDGKKELTKIFEEAKNNPNTVVIIDEIHRLNKDKQDLLLPHVESGLITIIGCTTSNPYFAINPAIRSRCQLLEVKPLSVEDVVKAIKNACSKLDVSIEDKAYEMIASLSNGDLRYAYNLLEVCLVASRDKQITFDIVEEYAGKSNIGLDSDEDGHYDAVSAFQKSIRGSDANAALYYLARLAATNDMDSIERRLLVTAYEDIGLANPNLCARTVLAIDVAKRVGFPEALIPLGDIIIELCLSPKSKSGNNAIHAAYDLATSKPLPVPVYLRLTPVGLKENEKYDYSASRKWHLIQYLPDEIADTKFYEPSQIGYEKELYEMYKKLCSYRRTNDMKEIHKK